MDIAKFHKQFQKEYTFLYENRNMVAGFREAANAFDKFAQANQEFVCEYVRYRGDCISSDREAAAFMFALEVMTTKE